MSGWNKKLKVKRRYDVTASMYDARYAEEQTAKYEAASKILTLEKHGVMLDAGCGTGLLFSNLAGGARTVVGLDFSKKTLLRAKERASDYPAIHLVCADADYMPFGEATFDYIFAVTLIQNVPNRVGTLNEIKRISRNNAKIVVTGLKSIFSENEFESLLKNAGLRMIAAGNEKNLKCHVAVCVKIGR